MILKEKNGISERDEILNRFDWSNHNTLADRYIVSYQWQKISHICSCPFQKIVNAGKRTHNFQLDCSIQQNFDESLSLSYSVWVYSRHKRLGTAIIADGFNEQNECVTDLD